jgi:hypothetical protein
LLGAGEFSTGEMGNFQPALTEHYKFANKANDIYRFVPLIGERLATSCSLDILFLRRDAPGGLVKHGGDLDNRIKVLFDALRMPQNRGELPTSAPETDEDPFYCLLEDDRFINGVTITTDKLLTPLEPNSEERIHDVLLVICVKTVVLNPYHAPWAFW